MVWSSILPLKSWWYRYGSYTQAGRTEGEPGCSVCGWYWERERERERGRNTVSIKAVSWRKRVQAASPVGLQHGSRTELACIRECICVWKSGGWDANEVNVTARMSAGSPGCLLHSLCFSVGWLDTKSSLIGEEVLAVHTPSGSQKFWGKKKKSNRINNLPSRSGLSSSKVSLWFGLESSVPFWS